MCPCGSSPVKILLQNFSAIQPWHVGCTCLILSAYLWALEFKDLLYYSTKQFLRFILTIFFHDIDVVGRDKLPRHGPVIFVSNHPNQFIDAMMILCSCQYKVSYLIAEVSWNRRIVGDLAWAMGSVPLKRPQDEAKVGIGMVKFSQHDYENNKVLSVEGIDTKFTEQVAKGDCIRPVGTPSELKVIQVTDNKTMLVDGIGISPTELVSVFGREEPSAFDVLKRIGQRDVYDSVLEMLSSGGCIGIFPEGDSHDRTDLLPLKFGVSLLAYSALEKDGLNVPIVPVGLNYFRTHRWRGRAVVEYGEPIYIDPNTLNSYKAGGSERRQVCSELMERIADNMRSVIVSTPDYESLQLIHTARRLYQRKGLEAGQKQELARRFAEGYKMLLLMTKGDPPEA